jgi:hypothetical protein
MSKNIDFYKVSEKMDQAVAGKISFAISCSRLFQVRRHHFVQLHNMGMSIKEMHALFVDEMNGISYQHFANELRQVLKEREEHQQQGTQQDKEAVSPSFARSAVSEKTVAGKAPSAPLSHALPLVRQEPIEELDPIPTPIAKSPSRPAQSTHQEEKSKGTPTVPKVLSTKERELLEKQKDDASRSALYPEVVYRLKEGWDGSWNRSARTALDMTRYGNYHNEYLKHRAVEVYEFLDPQERDAMQADMSSDNFKSSVNKSFLETLRTITHPDYRVTTVIAYQDGKTLVADAKVVEAIRAGDVRTWHDFDVREREISSKTSKGW